MFWNECTDGRPLKTQGNHMGYSLYWSTDNSTPCCIAFGDKESGPKKENSPKITLLNNNEHIREKINKEIKMKLYFLINSITIIFVL